MDPVTELVGVRPRVAILDRISVRPSAFDRLSGPGVPPTTISIPGEDGDSRLMEAPRDGQLLDGTPQVAWRRRLFRIWPLCVARMG